MGFKKRDNMMRTVKRKVVRAPKEKFSWTKEISKLKVDGEPLRVDISDRGKIAPLLSREIKVKHPNRVYKTDSVTEPGVLLVYRTA